MPGNFLDHVYSTAPQEDSETFYDAWATTYEDELGQNGYATPSRVARTMAKHIPDKSTPVLDFGCGTGLSGAALRKAGFSTIDGMDPSAEMLAKAQDKEAYRSTRKIEINDPNPIAPGGYKAIVAVGVIGIGAAPPETFDLLLRALPSGGILGVNLNDRALEEKVYERTLCTWLDPGAARLLFKKNGPHLPERGVKSTVYIIEKT